MKGAAQLIEIFSKAKLLPAGMERDAFLADACRDQPELKEDVVSLLRADEAVGDFLEPAPLDPFHAAITEKLGDCIGRYKLLEKIGVGGFGIVWIAAQESPVRRQVALKIIKLGMDTREVIARFEQERQALAMMDHPNIAKVFEAGATETGRPYFVMELVRGVKITDYCDQASLSTTERLALFITVCHAVQHAHQKGIIHRDIKPSNILVTLHDGVPVPKVIDFGVAKATLGQLGDFSIYTQAQQMIGTPLYMSPEQAEMSGLDVDTRTDIYALGVLLYELLTGRTPFDADEFMIAGHDEMRRMIREQEPLNPSTALHTMAQEKLASVAHHRASEPPKLIHAIHGDLDCIVMKTLEKDRARRYDTANGLAADIRRHLENEPVTARPPSRVYQFRKLVRRNKLAFAFAAAITASLIAGFATTTWMYLREKDARRRATAAEELATERLAEVSAERDAKEMALQEAEAISALVAEVFQRSNPALDGRTVTVAQTLDTAAKKLDGTLAHQPARRVWLQAILGHTYSALGLYREAMPLREKVLDYHRTKSGANHPDTLKAMGVLSVSYAEIGRRDEALKLREEALPASRKALGLQHPRTLDAMTGLANSYFGAGRLEEALQLREEVLPLHRRVSGPEHLTTLWAMNNLALSYATANRHGEALMLREQGLRLRTKVLGPEHPETLDAMSALASSYHAVGRRENALELREQLMGLRLEVLGQEHPETLNAMNDLANSYAMSGKQDEALKLRYGALMRRRTLLGREHHHTIRATQDLALSYADANRQVEALELWEEVLTLRRKLFGPMHQDTLKTMNDLAISYRANGEVAKAEAIEAELVAVGAGLKRDRDLP